MLRNLVLVGGGHTHSLLLHTFAENPLPDTRITLVSDVDDAPYSGMLPGHVAGLYTHREMHIDLPALCEATGTDFLRAEVNAFDPDSRILRTLDGRSLDLSPDFLSFNVGSVPKRDSVPGAKEFAIPSKPVPDLLAGWEKLRGIESPGRIALVGGGAGGVELALAMKSQLSGNTPLTLVHAGGALMSGHAPHVGKILTGLLQERGVELCLGRRVNEVTADGLHLDDGSHLAADTVFWVTQPSPPTWLSETGLALSENGFLRVQPTLQTLDYPWIFAAGDVAAIEDTSLPRSGVYAVRMAKPLEENVRAALAGQPLTNYDPQQRILSLIGTADEKAVASWGPFAFRSASMWNWKDQIDRKFMRQFEEVSAN